MMQYAPPHDAQAFAPLSLARRAHESHAQTGNRRPLPRFRSEQLFGNATEVVIEHAGEEYRLRWTRNDKLILNK